MRYDLTDLRLLVAVVEAGSMAEAARRAHISVSALFERIKALEARSGVRLFDRSAKGSRPTNAGLSVAAHARAVLREAERLDGALDTWKGRAAGTVVVRANSNAMTGFLPDVLASFLAVHPDVTVDLLEDNSDEIASAVRSGDADLGIVASNAELGGTNCRAIMTDVLVLLLPPGHRLAAREQVTFAEVLGESMISLDANSAIRNYLLKHARKIGREFSPRVSVRSFESLCRMVAAGAGCGILPVSVIPPQTFRRGATVVRLSDDWAPRELCICLPKEREISPLVARLAKFIAEATRRSPFAAAPLSSAPET